MNLRLKIRALLISAARRRRLVYYDELFAIAPAVSRSELFTELEEASASIAPLSEVIYSALMARRDTGLPGDGFYDAVRVQRSDLWNGVTEGRNPHVLDLTVDEKRTITELEREHVYADALGRNMT